MPKPPERERSPRERLLELERSGRYVFHGSARSIETLEPRQGKNFSPASRRMEPDGAPAVAATEHADIAIFRALVNQDQFPDYGYYSAFGVADGKPYVKMSKAVLAGLREKVGYVHVLPRKMFQPVRGEWRAETSVHPDFVVRVTASDFQIDDIIMQEKP